MFWLMYPSAFFRDSVIILISFRVFGLLSSSLLLYSLHFGQYAVVWGKIEKSGMADTILKEKGNHLPLWDEIRIINRDEHWRIRCLKESAHMLDYSDLLSRQSIEMNIYGNQ